jgi:hypothetical protein
LIEPLGDGVVRVLTRSFKNANCPARRLTMAAAILSFGVIGIIQPSVDETLANSSQNVNLVYSIFIA